MLEFIVTGMTCAHCVNAVTKALSSLPGVAGVAVDLPSNRVHIQGKPDMDAVRAAIEDEGYGVETATRSSQPG